MMFYSTITTITFLYVILTHSTSNYTGVYWVKKSNKWAATVVVNSKRYYGGCFDEEIEAAKKVNQLCDELEIERKNSELHAIYKRKARKTSQYKGVHWSTQTKKWYSQLHSKYASKKFGGYFDDEQDAAKQVNQLCQELGLIAKNPGISGSPLKHKVT
jgi:hypothetical protein